jgi:curved DNA-binding protein CbpA
MPATIEPMSDTNSPDWYEILQVSPRADADTIVGVFRVLAKRLHPDNPDSGDAERFALVMEAFRILSDPELRARFDSRYERARERRWRVFNQDSATDDIVSDRNIRTALLNLLYTVRRNDPDSPGLGMVHLENVLGCPEQHLKFHIWYLRENGWVYRLENGLLAITASGVDRVLDEGGPASHRLPQLESAERARARSRVAVNGDNGARTIDPADAA